MFGVATQNGVGLGLGNIPSLTSLPYNVQLNLAVQSLFANGEPGFWLDPSDFSTMYQDAAGTTPVTAVAQPVGRINDKSGRGCNYTQSTAGVRPVLSARVNLLTKTELWTAAWSKDAGVTSGTVSTAPDGTSTACTVLLAAGTGSHAFFQQGSAAGTTLTNSVIAKAGTASWLGLGFDTAVTTDGAFFDLTNGVKGTVAAGTTATMAAHPQYAGWYICTVTRTHTSALHYLSIEVHSADNQSATFNAVGTETIQVWHPDIRPNDQFNSLIPTYQRVNTSTDYDTAGFPLYLSSNGTQWMQCASQDYTGVNKMLVCAGVRKVANAISTIVELSTTIDTNSGFLVYTNPSNNDAASLGPVGARSYVFSAYGSNPIPSTYVYSVSFSRAGSGAANQIPVFHVNAATPSLTYMLDGGSTGNFGNLPAYIFSRAGASMFLTGNIYQLIARGSTVASNAAQISVVENWTDLKTKAY